MRALLASWHMLVPYCKRMMHAMSMARLRQTWCSPVRTTVCHASTATAQAVYIDEHGALLSPYAADAEASGKAMKTVRDAMRTARRLRRPCRDCTWAVECILTGRLPDDVRAAIVANDAEAGRGGSSPEAPPGGPEAAGRQHPGGQFEQAPMQTRAPQKQKQRGCSGASSGGTSAPAKQRRASTTCQLGQPRLLERADGPPPGVDVPADDRTFYNAAQLVGVTLGLWAHTHAIAQHVAFQAMKTTTRRQTMTLCAAAVLRNTLQCTPTTHRRCCMCSRCGSNLVAAAGSCRWHWPVACTVQRCACSRAAVQWAHSARVPLKPLPNRKQCTTNENHHRLWSCTVASTCFLGLHWIVSKRRWKLLCCPRVVGSPIPVLVDMCANTNLTIFVMVCVGLQSYREPQRSPCDPPFVCGVVAT